MVKLDNINKQTNLMTIFLNKMLGIFFIGISLSLLLIILSFDAKDPGWGFVSNKTPSNLYNEYGALISGFIVRELGVFTGVLVSLLFFNWSLKFFNKSSIKFWKLKIISFFLMIFLSLMGGAYIEKLLINYFKINFEIINQTGFSEWTLSYLSSHLDKAFLIDNSYSEDILGLSAFLGSIILFLWILSLNFEEKKILKLIFRPFFLPFLWILSVLYNLFFKANINNVDDINTKGHFLSIGSIYQKFLKKLIFQNSIFQRKKPKIRKYPILIKNNEINTKKSRNSSLTNTFQDNLALTSESGFVLPPISLLQNSIETIQPPSKESLDSNAKVLEGVLADYSINGQIDTVRPGPVITRYDLQPAPGLRSQRVISLAEDIARSMSAEAVRVAMVPGQNVIGIELPNKIRETVILRNILEHKEFQDSNLKLPVCLGKNIAGYPVVVDLAKMPHLLVAGTTGSGKSVGINAMILSLLYKHTPDTCRLIMIDPKMLELSVYDGIPHLLTPVVTDPSKAITALKWAVREMETRYMSMSKLGVRNIDSYNERLVEARRKGEVLTKNIQVGFDPDTGQAIYEDQHINLTPLPFIVVIIDEVADLMLVAGKDIEAAVQRLAQMARAAGIHVVMATQRPSVDVITGTIKANFPTRISFQVTSKIDSRTILGEQGAEQLLGRGDMLYMAGGGKVTRVHGPFVDDVEVEKVTSFLSNQSVPDYDETITEEPDSINNEGFFGLKDNKNNQADELYDQAVALIARERRASTSFIQRHFKIGYNRAATIIEKMEENNVVSKPGRAGKREVLIEDH